MKFQTVQSLAELVGGQVVGDGDVRISGVADLRQAGPGDVGFVRDPRYADLVGQSRAGCVIVRNAMELAVPQIVVRNPHAAFARVALFFHPLPRATEHRVHPTAAVDPDAVLEAPVEVGPHATIGRGARIGAGTVIGANSVIGAGSELGRDCSIFPRVVVYDRVRIGDRVVLHSGTVVGSDGFGYARDEAEWVRLPQIGDVVVEDDVEIGANCAIDRGALGRTRIGRGTKIDNLVHVGHNCEFGEHCLVAGFSAFAGSSIFGDRVTIAGHVVAGGHLRVVDDVRIGGNSSVWGDIAEPGDYMGYPLQPKTRWMRTLVAIRRLPDVLPQLNALRREADGASGSEV
jgi:UDP-3-O-[3-hydroxymyristoyl] glucosamine N-acyltransferase